MNRLFVLTVVSLLLGLMISTANAGKSGGTAPVTDPVQVNPSVKGGKTAEATGKKAGYSVDKEYKKRVEAKKKAMNLREKSMRSN